MIMAQLMLIDDDPGVLVILKDILQEEGYTLVTASSGREGLAFLEHELVDLILSDLRLPDISWLEILRQLRAKQRPIPFVIITDFGNARDAVEAMRLGALDFVEKPISRENLLRILEGALGEGDEYVSPGRLRDEASVLTGHEAHAAARWARAVAPTVDSPRDPRTILDWSRIVFSSPSALRNWCRMAGMSPRRSLVFARLLRAVSLGRRGRHKPENLLDVVDRRTLVGLLKLAGLNPWHDLPDSVDAFLEQQTLVRDPDTLLEIRRALQVRRDRAPHPSVCRSSNR